VQLQTLNDGRMTETCSAATKKYMLRKKPGLIRFDLITTQRMQATKCISLKLMCKRDNGKFVSG
jgi:hypothetical protein